MLSSLRLLFLVIFNISTMYAQRTQFLCDYKYNSEANGWFKFHEIPSNWNEARLRCFMEGAILASPLTPSLANATVDLMKNYNVGGPIFTGIHATFSRGDFNSIEGTPLQKIPHTWARGEPDNCNDEESCIILLPDGTMADEKCKSTFPYMCFKPTTPMIITGCGTVDPEYTIDTRTGSCYKFHRVPRTWSRAFMTCQAEGGYLAIINSETEATVIIEVFARNPSSLMVGGFWKDIALVGFHDWTQQGDWRTIHGETLNKAGYSKFAAGEPNNGGTGEYCGGVHRNTGLLYDMGCENKYAFICEKDPYSLTCDNN